MLVLFLFLISLFFPPSLILIQNMSFIFSFFRSDETKSFTRLVSKSERNQQSSFLSYSQLLKMLMYLCAWVYALLARRLTHSMNVCETKIQAFISYC